MLKCYILAKFNHHPVLPGQNYAVRHFVSVNMFIFLTFHECEFSHCLPTLSYLLSTRYVTNVILRYQALPLFSVQH